MRIAIPTVLVLACALPASAADPAPGVVRVTATYPGADARTVDETVLGPLVEQINGVEGADRIESEARNDGTGTVTVYFEPKTDLNLAQLFVQSRANLALPVIPAPCRELGLPVRKLPAGPPTYYLALSSADDKHGAEFLGIYATALLKPTLARIPGVADLRVVGVGRFSLRVGFNPDRLRAYELMAGDVVEALRRQNVQVAAGGTVGGRALQHAITASGRLTSFDQLDDVILKASPKGEVLRLRDVARVEFGCAAGGGFARVDGRPAVLIAVTAWPGRKTADQLRAVDIDLPPGVRLDVVADRAADRLLEVGMRLADSASPEQTEKAVERATELIRGLPGKPGTVAFTEGRERNAATILVKLPAEGGPTAADVKTALGTIPDAAIRVGSVRSGGEAFPVRLALTGRVPWEEGEDSLREAADRVVARLKKDPALTEPAAFPGPATKQLAVNVDRDVCATLGVELDSVFTTIQASFGGVHATNFNTHGLIWPVTVQAEPWPVLQVEDLTILHWVRNKYGEMVPLAKVVKVRKALAPTAVLRVDGLRAIIITAEPAAGKTPAETAARCVKAAQEILPRGYRVKDLTGPPP